MYGKGTVCKLPTVAVCEMLLAQPVENLERKAKT